MQEKSCGCEGHFKQFPWFFALWTIFQTNETKINSIEKGKKIVLDCPH